MKDTKNNVSDLIIANNTVFITGIIEGLTVLPITDNNDCVFLDQDKKCAIYFDRPIVCRLYGLIPELPCPYIDLNGTQRPEHEIPIIKELIKFRINKFVSEQKTIASKRSLK